MNRLFALAAFAALVGTTLLVTSTSASAHDRGKVTLYGFVKGIKTDGAFPAKVSFIDPITEQTVATTKTTVDIQNGDYHAVLDAPGLDKNATYKVSMKGLEAAKDFTVIDYVQLQSSTPGSQQTGHLNISGYVLASRIGLGVSPTLAKVQVNETGTAQGVRSITNSGVAVYGQATAGTGLASGGYFTTSSVGGRAMVGDALSTTGSTVGGLFYNRSSDGVAVWGRHIKTTGNSIGVFGQTASPDGTAVMAQNSSTGDSVQLAGPEGSLVTHGVLPRHEYATGVSAAMVPVAYGVVGSSGEIWEAGSGNWTSSHVAAGQYLVQVAGQPRIEVVATTPYHPGATVLTSYSAGIGGLLNLYYYDRATGNPVDGYVSFIVYSANAGSTARSQLPLIVLSKYKGDIQAWKEADPKGYETFRLAKLAAEQKANRANPVTVPYDEGEPAGQLTRNNVLPPRQ